MPDDFLSELREYQRTTSDMEQTIDARARAVEAAKATLKDAREQHQAAQASLQAYIAAWREEGSRPLFKEPDEDDDLCEM